MFKEFKEFIMKGNVLDLAVAVIIGGAMGKIITSLVNDVLMPLIGLALGKVDISEIRYIITPSVGDTPEVAIYYGRFIQNIVDFVIIAFVIFMMLKVVTKISKKKEEEPAAPPAPSDEVVLLTEIRDLLKK